MAASWVTGGGGTGTLRSDHAGCIGGDFTVGAASIVVVSLGRWVIAGNTLTHVIRLTDASGTVLGSVTVNTSGAPTGTFLFADLATQVVLEPGTKYYLLCEETSGGDQWYDADSVLTTTNKASIGLSAYIYGACSGVGSPAAPGMYVTLSFQYLTDHRFLNAGVRPRPFAPGLAR